MPTTLPARIETAGAIRRLSLLDTLRFVILVAQVRWLGRRLEAAHSRVQRHGLDIAGAELVLAARRWLACHEAIGALLGTAEPSEVSQMRATLKPPKPSVASSEEAP